MIGVDAQTGKPLAGVAHLVQSIADILTTPIGTRVARRDYGSLLFELIGRPMNGLGKQRIYGAIATALARWEPRIRVLKIAFTRAGSDGVFDLSLDIVSTEEPAPNGLLQLAIPLRFPTPSA